MNRPLLWITERYPPDRGGMAESCARLVEGLRRRDVPLDVAALADPASAALLETTARDGGTDYRLRRRSDPGETAQALRRLVELEHGRRPYGALVGFGAGFAGYLATTFAAWLGLPSAVLVRGNDFDRDWFDPRRAHFVRESLVRAGAVGAVSTEKAERIRALFPTQKVLWTPNGVDPARWELLPGEVRRRDEVREKLAGDGRRVVGLFGELKAKKGAPLWLAALREAGLLDRTALLVVGRVDQETAEILDDEALAPFSLRLSFVPRDSLPPLYGACDFIALPSLYDGLPNVLLEAMSAGVIPVASDAGGLRDVVTDGETGFLFRAGDQTGAARATARALALPDAELAALKARVREHAAQSFTLDRELDAVLELIELAGG